MRKNSKAKYITLKEAAAISGYAPDYVGQLIRSGKIEGKQVYSNVAWVTTEDAVREYAARGKKRGKTRSSKSGLFSFSADHLMRRLYRFGLFVLIGAASLFGLFLFYILSINLEDYLENRASQKAEERALSVPMPETDETPRLPL